MTDDAAGELVREVTAEEQIVGYLEASVMTGWPIAPRAVEGWVFCVGPHGFPVAIHCQKT